MAWEPGTPPTPPLSQAQHYWYQWFMATERGAQVVRDDPKAWARHQWVTWGPPHWFDEAAFAKTAQAFTNPDWPDVTLHSYRVRRGEAEPDPHYADIEQRSKSAKTIAVPTLMIQGGADRCLLPASSEGKEKNFSGPYSRHVLDGVGHFPTREAPRSVGDLLVAFLAT